MLATTTASERASNRQTPNVNDRYNLIFVIQFKKCKASNLSKKRLYVSRSTIQVFRLTSGCFFVCYSYWCLTVDLSAIFNVLILFRSGSSVWNCPQKKLYIKKCFLVNQWLCKYVDYLQITLTTTRFSCCSHCFVAELFDYVVNLVYFCYLFFQRKWK